jgi:hypothetical protein
VAADILSLSLTVDGGLANTVILQLAINGQDVLNLDNINVPPFRRGAAPAASVVLPISPNTFPVGPSCYAVVPVALGDVEGGFGELDVVSRRDGGGMGRFDVNVIKATGADISDADINEALGIMSQVYFDGNAASLQSVDSYTIPGFDFVDPEGQSIQNLRAAQVGTDPRRFNIFIVEDFLDAQGDPVGLYGIAGGVPGPNGVSQSAASGVVVGVAAHRLQDGTIDVEELAATIGHELGHQIGLFHTSEADGTAHDNFTDTPECTAARDANQDGFVSPQECAGFSDENVMFWTAGSLPQEQLTAQQSEIMFFSPGMY